VVAGENGCEVHPLARRQAGRRCPLCRREQIIAMAAVAVPGMAPLAVRAAVNAVATSPQAVRDLAAALSTGPEALQLGAPPVVGRLVNELRERGAALAEPTCAMCARTGRPLTRSDCGGVCPRCRRRQLAMACSRCGVVKPVAGRDQDHRPVCARCQDRPQRPCGQCGRTRRIAQRGRDGLPDICDACFQMPQAICSRCQQRRPCSFASGPNPVCAQCTPRATASCAHCGNERPPTARWPEGPVCDPCYTAALRRRGTCASCHQQRRLVDPPGPAATTCADCTTTATPHLRVSHVCTDCATEDKLYERGRCPRCALRRRTAELLRGGSELIPPALMPVYEAIIATDTPRSALNWLRKGSGAALLAQMTAGTLALSHETLDAHPRPQAASYLRAVLVANMVLPARDEALLATERFLTDTLAGIRSPADRRLVHAYATWRVLNRLRRSAQRADRPRTHARHAHLNINAAARFLNWLSEQEITLDHAGQGDVDQWLTAGHARYQVRDFLGWAARSGHARPLLVPTLGSNPGQSTSKDERWALIAKLLHDDTIDLTDRVAGCLLLLYGQQLSRITAITTDQVTTTGNWVFLRFGRQDVLIPEPLAGLLQTLVREGRRYLGVGSPTTTIWLFPGMLPGRPLTPSRLGERLRKLGLRAQPARRATLTDLAAQLPAAVLADLLNLAPTTAVNWVRDAGGDWSRYAAQLAQDASHQTC
jgi:hypothetical protein